MTTRLGRAVLGVTSARSVRGLLTTTRPGRAVASRFVAGETLADAAATARDLNTRGASVSLDHLGEHVTDLAAAEGARDDYLTCLDRIEGEGLDANISVKLTQLGLRIDPAFTTEAVGRLAERARRAGTTVTIDMEESEHTEATIGIFETVQSTGGNVGIALQAYLHRTRTDLGRIIPCGGHVRLCKGAYAEPATVALQKKADVDANFDVLLRLLMGAPNVMTAVATHDSDRIRLAVELARGRSGSWELQMLYGVRDTLQRDLITAGHPLRVYVPYGVAWYPYLTRRLAERPANLVFFMRAVVGR